MFLFKCLLYQESNAMKYINTPKRLKEILPPLKIKKKAMESAAKDCSPFHRQRKSSLPIQKKEYEKSCKSAFHILFFWIRKEDFLFL